MDATVRNDPEANRYEIREGDQLLGIVAYQHRGSTLVMTHTEVDQDAGRSGLGSSLVRGALDDVRSQGIKVVPLCPFVRGWIDRHPDYADLVADDDA
jgi:predicted GNAT family acetyltransferase